MLDYRAKHLQGVEDKEGQQLIFAVIAAAGGPTITELNDMKLSDSAELRAQWGDACENYGDIVPVHPEGWNIELRHAIGNGVTTVYMREPRGKDMKTPGRSKYQHNRNLLLGLLSAPDSDTPILPSDIDEMGMGDYLNIIHHINVVSGVDYQGF